MTKPSYIQYAAFVMVYLSTDTVHYSTLWSNTVKFAVTVYGASEKLVFNVMH